MSFLFLRGFLTAVMFNAGLGYAAFLALHSLFSHLSRSSLSSKDQQSPSPPDADEKKHTDGAELLLRALKLWIILTFLSSLSYLGADCIPLFLELRAIFTWLLLCVPPTSHVTVYDCAFEPLFLHIGAAITALTRKKMFARKVGLCAVRGCVELGVLITKCVQQSGELEEDAVHDIVGGLLFTRRALQDVKKMDSGRIRGLPSPYHEVKLNF